MGVQVLWSSDHSDGWWKGEEDRGWTNKFVKCLSVLPTARLVVTSRSLNELGSWVLIYQGLQRDV